jgi:hypothetical protein
MIVTAYRTGGLGIHRPADHAHPEPVRVPVGVRSSARPVTVQRAPPANTFQAVRIRQGPSMYEMEGPCPASPRWLASRPALPTPRAARRGQVPAQGTGLPAPPTFPGLPPGGARFRTAKTFLPPRRAARKSPRPAISGFSLSTIKSTESGWLSRFNYGYPRAHSQPIHRPRCQPGNTTTAGAECNRLSFPQRTWQH